MNDENNFTKNFRDAIGASLDKAIANSAKVPARDANDPNLNAQNDPLAIQNDTSKRLIMQYPQDFDDNVKSFLPEILSNSMAIDKTGNGDRLLIDVNSIVNNLKRIGGDTYNKDYVPGGNNGADWIGVPIPSNASINTVSMPKTANYKKFLERLYLTRNGGR